MSMLPPETDPTVNPVPNAAQAAANPAPPITAVEPGADTAPQTIDDTTGPDDPNQRTLSAMLDEAESRLDEAERNVADLLVQSMTDVPIDREDIVLSETGDSTRPGRLIPQDPNAHPTGPVVAAVPTVDLPDGGGFDGNGVWHDGGTGRFARKGWSTAKAAMLRALRGGANDVLDGRHGPTMLKVKDRGLADRLGADADSLVEAVYADAEHAIVTDWRGRKVRVPWDSFDPDFTPVDVPRPFRGDINGMPDRPESPEALARRIIPGNLASPADFAATKASLAQWSTRDLIAAHGTLDVPDPSPRVDDALTAVGLEGRNRGIEFGYDGDGRAAAFRWDDDPTGDLGAPLTPAELDALDPPAVGETNGMPDRPWEDGGPTPVTPERGDIVFAVRNGRATKVQFAGFEDRFGKPGVRIVNPDKGVSDLEPADGIAFYASEADALDALDRSVFAEAAAADQPPAPDGGGWRSYVVEMRHAKVSSDISRHAQVDELTPAYQGGTPAVRARTPEEAIAKAGANAAEWPTGRVRLWGDTGEPQTFPVIVDGNPVDPETGRQVRGPGARPTLDQFPLAPGKRTVEFAPPSKTDVKFGRKQYGMTEWEARVAGRPTYVGSIRQNADGTYQAGDSAPAKTRYEAVVNAARDQWERRNPDPQAAFDAEQATLTADRQARYEAAVARWEEANAAHQTALARLGQANDMPTRPINANVNDDPFHEYEPATIPVADLRRGDIILDEFNTADKLVTGTPSPDGTVRVVDPHNPDANRTLDQWTPDGPTVTINATRPTTPTTPPTPTTLGDDNPALHGTHHLLTGSRYDGEWNITDARPTGTDGYYRITDNRGRIYTTHPDDMFPTEQAARTAARERRNPRRTTEQLDAAYMTRMGQWGYIMPRPGTKQPTRNTPTSTAPTPTNEPNDLRPPTITGDTIRANTLAMNGGIHGNAAQAIANGRPIIDVAYLTDGDSVALTRTHGVLTTDGGFLAGSAPERTGFPVSFGPPDWQAEGYGRTVAGYGAAVRVRRDGEPDGRLVDLGGELNDMPVRPLPAPDERGVYPTVDAVGPEDVEWATGPDPDFPEDTVSVTEVAGQFVGTDTTEHPFNRTAITVAGSGGRWTWMVDAANPESADGSRFAVGNDYWMETYQAKVDPFAWSDPTDAPSWYEEGEAVSLEQAQADALAAANRMPAATIFKPLDATHRAGLTDEAIADRKRRSSQAGRWTRGFSSSSGSWKSAGRSEPVVETFDTSPPTGEGNDFRSEELTADPAVMSYTDLGHALTAVKADLAAARREAVISQPGATRQSSTAARRAPFKARLAAATERIGAGQAIEARLTKAIADRGLIAQESDSGWIVGPPEHFQPSPTDVVPTPPTAPAAPGDGLAGGTGGVPDIEALRAELTDAERALRVRGIDREAAETRRAEAFLALAQAEEAERQANGVTVEYPAAQVTVLVPPDADNPGTRTYDPVTGGPSPMKLNAPHGVVVIRGTIADPQFDARTPEEAWKRTKLDAARPGYRWGMARGPEPKLLILTEQTAARWKAAYEGTIAEMDAAKARRAEVAAARKAARDARQATLPDPNDVADMSPAERLAKSTTGSAWLVAKDNYLSRIGVEKGQAVQVRADGDSWVIDVLDGGERRAQTVKLDRFADTAPAGVGHVEVPEARGNAAVAAKADAAAVVAARVQAAGDAGAPVEVADSYLTRYGAPKGSIVTVTYLDDRNAALTVDGRQVKAGWARFTARIPEPTGDGSYDLIDPPPTGDTNDMPDRPDDDTVVATMLRQIGGMNLMAISGGRRTAIVNDRDEAVGVRLPVAAGYRVDVVYDQASDTYTVSRVFSRGGRDFPKGTMTNIYADQLGDIAYLASSFRSDPFGTVGESNDMADGQLGLLDLAPDEMRAITNATPVFADAGWYPTDAIGGFRSPDGKVTVTRVQQNNGRMVFAATSTARSVFTNNVGEYRNDDPARVIAWADERAKLAAETPVDTGRLVSDDRLATIAADPNITLYPASDLLDSRKGRYGIIAGNTDGTVRDLLGQWRTPQEAAGAWTDIRRRVIALADDPDGPDKLDAGAAKAPTFARPANVKASAARPGDWVTSIQGVTDLPAEGARIVSAPTMDDGQVRLELAIPGGRGTVSQRYETVSPLAAVAIYRPIETPDADRPTHTESVGPVAFAAMTPEQRQAVRDAAHRVAAAAPIGTERHTEAVNVADTTVEDRSPAAVDGMIVEASGVHLDPHGVPPKAGTAPIPEGAVRLYQYPQNTALDFVLATGIDTTGATQWAQTRPPVADVIPYVEFWTNPANIAAGDAYGKGHVALAAPVPPTNIVSYSTPTIAALRTFRESPTVWTPDRLTSVLGRYPAGSPEAAAVRARLAELGVDLSLPQKGEGNDFRPFDLVRSAMNRTPDPEYLVALAATGVPNGDGRVVTADEIRAMSPSELVSLDRAMSRYLAAHPYGDLGGTDIINTLKLAPDATPDAPEPAPAATTARTGNGGTLGYIPMSPLDAPGDWEAGVAAAMLAEVDDIDPDAPPPRYYTVAEVRQAYYDAYGDADPDAIIARLRAEQEAVAAALPASEALDANGRPLNVGDHVITHDGIMALPRDNTTDGYWNPVALRAHTYPVPETPEGSPDWVAYVADLDHGTVTQVHDNGEVTVDHWAEHGGPLRFPAEWVEFDPEGWDGEGGPDPRAVEALDLDPTDRTADWSVAAALDLSDDRLSELLTAYGSAVTDVLPDGSHLYDGPTIDDVGIDYPAEPVPDLIREVLRLRDVADHYGADPAVVRREVLGRCPECGADWKATELVGAARHGGGYRVHCHECDHEWDDAAASHAARADARPVVAAVLTPDQHDQRVAASKAAAERRRQRAKNRAEAAAAGRKPSVDMSLPGSTTQPGNSYPHRPADAAPDPNTPDPAAQAAAAGKFFDALNKAFDDGADVDNVPAAQFDQLTDGLAKAGYGTEYLNDGRMQVTDPKTNRKFTMRRRLV